MKKHILFFIVTAATVCLFFFSCINTENRTGSADMIGQDITNTADNIRNIAAITGKDWKLTRVYIGGTDTQFRRESQPEMLRDIYTLKFDGQNVSGTGAPNLYSAPYTTGENQTISIMPMRSTLMASIFEPVSLSEHAFYSYLQNTGSWKLENNNLELISKTDDGREVRLVFQQ